MFKRTLRKLMLALILVAPAAAAEPLVFTAIPDQDETKLRERFQKVADYLAEELDTEVRFVPVKSYAAAVTAFRNNQVQLAWFGGLSGVQARQLVPGSEALAQGVEDAQFRTYFIAHESTGLEPSDQLPEAMEGMTFTFGSKGSTSGRLMPEYYIRQQFDAAPEDVFSRVGFSGNHSRTIDLVESGTYQTGALNFAVWESEVAAGNVDTDAVKVIWETPTYADYQWTIRGDVDERFGEGFKERVREALVDMNDPALLASFPREGFIPASNDDYQGIRETARALDLID
ncbi:putative selenate ABC transporter substrate-binding protein [Halomonas sp. McH1-25]|uniref:putative selenate ABC transporter substrate-binding protein n=1 Tax=unclassified Halomonas TaxID=2609666 RepID=UPI001EF6E2CF|nr:MULTISPECIES: putative selenate ABC transporter substrate-binding protein [unclassified Halomonas]MCG7600193.1 putative selenate ABC transporter substrate-binding protein [Halomonas sp. McH1-25]MCP1341442.1 putative selenate ABC transporter substrate-binding protein [Halomonas sp. FL8]MCP1363402.1 putative selenate ABC transporter substrate-binding protein [Halomonas sp. BBD45]MCP1364365.1 putative selenate ABC transporter substrate-binding protein [Halomonas sp. BBD48]